MAGSAIWAERRGGGAPCPPLGVLGSPGLSLLSAVARAPRKNGAVCCRRSVGMRPSVVGFSFQIGSQACVLAAEITPVFPSGVWSGKAFERSCPCPSAPLTALTALMVSYFRGVILQGTFHTFYLFSILKEIQ